MDISLPRLLRLVLTSFALMASIIYAVLLFQVAIRVGVEPASSDQRIAYNDFVALYAGAQLAAHGHLERAYDFDEVRSLERRLVRDTGFDGLPAVYPPFYYVLLRPFAELDMMWAYRLWIASSLFAVLLVAIRIEPHWQTLLLVPIFPAVAICVVAGQNGILSAALIGAGLLLLPNRPLAAGVALGLLAYKPQLAVAIPFCLIAGKHYRTLAAMSATVVASIALGAVVFGVSATLAFLPNLMAQGTKYLGGPSLPVWRRMPTAFVSTLQLSGNGPLAWTIFGLVAVASLLGLVYVWRKSKQPGLRALALAVAMPLVTPYFFDYDLAVLLIPALFLVREMRCSGSTWRLLVPLGALWLTQPIVKLMPPDSYWPFAPVVWMLLLAHTVWTSRQALPSSLSNR